MRPSEVHFRHARAAPTAFEFRLRKEAVTTRVSLSAEFGAPHRTDHQLSVQLPLEFCQGNARFGTGEAEEVTCGLRALASGLKPGRTEPRGSRSDLDQLKCPS